MKILIVDDEAPARDRLRRHLQAHRDLQIVGEANNGLQALTLTESLSPDVIFLDIEMPELGGLGVAEAILRMGSAPPAIVFATAFSEFAVQAFELNALDYLVKPVSESRLTSTLNKLRRNLPHKKAACAARLATATRTVQEKFALKVGAKFVVCEAVKISAVLASNHYSVIYTEGKEFLSTDSLDVLTFKLDPHIFVRVHRSAIVNLHFIKHLERLGDRKYVAVLSDPKVAKIPISREKLELLRSRFASLT